MHRRRNFINFLLLVLPLITTVAYSQTLKLEAVPNEYIVAYKPGMNPKIISSKGETDPVLKTARETLVKVTFKEKSSAVNRQALLKSSGILWIEPNYRVVGDPREADFNDPLLSEQLHHNLMENSLAWDIEQGTEDIVVAVTDDGVDIQHEDLTGQIWKNPNEVANNGIDDDQNGYVDDTYGYDFSADDNNVDPQGGSHGTHVAGIIVGSANNRKGIVGVAPKVKVMPIRFYGSGDWTSAVIAASYAYAADNGARIITTSFNIDIWVGNRVFETAVQYAYDRGLLHFNSAGNGYEANPKRQHFEQLMLTCSTIADNNKNDQKSTFSNYGLGVDLCAPGGGGALGILSSIPGNRYSRKSGTSMASPNAAAVAALIWSQHPQWSRDQVAAQLTGTADSIDTINPRYAGLLGSGRVNSFKALTTEAPAPRIHGVKGLTNGTTTAKVDGIVLSTKQILDPHTVNNLNNFELRKLANGESIKLTAEKPYRVGTQEFKLKVKSLASGKYQFRASPKIVDPFGRPIEEFILNFTVSK